MALFTTGATLVAAQASGSGSTTRYWDCCKPSCAWNDLATLGIDSAVKSCDAKDKPLSDTSAASGCSGGTAYMCSDQSPWAVSSDLAYGFAAVSASSPKCCQCYKLSFTSGAVSGKTMIVQATNTGSDVGSTQFDLAVSRLCDVTCSESSLNNTRSDAWRRLWHLRCLYIRMGRQVQYLGCAIWWLIHQHLLFIPQGSPSRL